MLKGAVPRRVFSVWLIITISSTPFFIVKSSPKEQRFLKQPIFGNLLFASELTLDSIMGGEYRVIDHPYVYMNTGRSVKCYEPESGRLAHTILYDLTTEEPYSAVNTGICFIKTDEKGARFFELRRYDGTQTLLPMADNAFMVYWEPKPVVWHIEKGNPEGTNLVRAVDERGQTAWKVDGLYNIPRDSSDRYWFRTNDGWFLVDPQTGKALATIPKGFGFIYARGSLVYLLHESKAGVSAILNIETGMLIHECKDRHHTIGRDGFLCYSNKPVAGTKDCFEFEKHSKEGQIVDKYKVKLPHEFSYANSFAGNFNEKFMTVWIPQESEMKMSIVDIEKNIIIFDIAGATRGQFLANNTLLIRSDRYIGCIDMNNLKQIWSMPVGNRYPLDTVYEKDFDRFKLVGRRVFNNNNKHGMSLQVRIVDKTDNSVEPFEFEFEHGGLRNCYETDFGFININDLTRFSIHTPQVSFYRKGTIKAVGIIDYIGEIIENTISIEDDRYLNAKLKDGRTISIDAREMNFSYK